MEEDIRNEQLIGILKEAINANNESIDALKDIIARCEELKERLAAAMAETLAD